MKFAPYTSADDALYRARLVAQAIQSVPEQARTTLLVAPAGYGKTTLLCHIQNAMRGQNFQTVWLNCTAEDRDPDVFLINLSQAFRAARLAEGVMDHSISDLMETLAESGPIALLLDEYENAASEASDAILENLIRSLPVNCRMFVASRELPTVSVAKLRLDGCVRIVDAAELRFTEQEISSVITTPNLPDGYASILRQSEGWPVMVQLTRLDLLCAAGEQPANSPRLGQTIGIFDYLAEQVLTRLPPTLRDFLLEISVLSEVDIPSAQAVTASTEAEKAMYDVLRLRPIVTVISEHPLAIRLHPLFRDFLRHESLNFPVTPATELHRRAALHFAAQNDLQKAVHHASSSGMEDLIIQILEDAGGAMLNVSEGYSRTRNYLATLPPSTIAKRPRLHLMRIMQRAMEGTSADWLDEFDQFIHCLNGPDGRHLNRDDDLVMQIDLIRGIGQISECRYGITDAPWTIIDERRRKSLARKFEEPRYYGLALVLEILLIVEYGSLQLAETRAAELAELFLSANYTPNMSWISNHQSNISIYKGDLIGAEYYSQMCLERVRSTGETRNTFMRQHIYAILGQCAYEQNKLEQAINLFEEIPKYIPYLLLSTATMSLCTAARAHLHLGDAARALQELQGAYDFAVMERLPHLNVIAAATMAELHLKLGNIAECERWIAAAELEKMLAKSQIWFSRPWLETEALVRLFALYWLQQGVIDRAHGLAHEFVTRAEQSGRQLVAAHMNVIVLETLLRKGLRDKAQAVMQQILSATAESGALRVFMDMNTDSIALLRALSRKKSEPHKAWIDAILAAIDAGGAYQGSGVNDVSPRERDVLRGLAQGQSTKVIARELDISHETVRHHLKRVYAKLDVHNRDEAVEEARRRGIIT
jgi:LuxR family maltose regulon positive regulatory protein